MVKIITGLISSTLNCIRKKDNSELIVGDIPTATKQTAGREGGPTSFLVHESKSNLNNLERALKIFKALIEFEYDAKCVQVIRVLVIIV